MNIKAPALLMMALSLLSLTCQPPARSEAPIQFAPPHAPQAWEPELAQSVVAATQVMVGQMDVGDADVSAWVARVPGDPPPAGLYDDVDWPYDLASAFAVELDLGESLKATAEIMGEDFEAQLEQGWTTRALALAADASGRPLLRQEYHLMPDDGMGSRSVSVHSPFVDLQRLEILEGTWVQIVRVRGEGF